MKLKPTALREAYVECLETLRMASKLGLPDRVLHFETIEFAHLFQNISSTMMEDYCTKILRPFTRKRCRVLARNDSYFRGVHSQ